MDLSSLSTELPTVNDTAKQVDMKEHEICEKLDKILCSYMAEIEQYMSLRKSLSDLIQNGNICISKARYVMGVSSVSDAQIPDKEFEAQITCRVEDSGGLITFTGIEGLNAGIQDEVYKGELRRRKGIPEVEKSANHEESDKQNVRTMEDPINWFGVLVPSSLRQGQKYFKQASNVVCELVNSSNRLERLQERFKRLKQEKRLQKFS